jgi:WD40 repeat protein
MALAAHVEGQSELLLRMSPGDSSPLNIPVKGFLSSFAIVFSPDGQSLAVGHDEGPILIYEVAGGATRTLVRDYGICTSCAYSPDGKSLAAASDTWNSVRIFDVATGEPLGSVPGQRVVAFSPDGRLLATESSDVREYYPIELWDIAAGKSAGQLIGHKGQILSIQFSTDGTALVTGSSDGTARLWNLDDRTQRLVLRAHQAGVHKVAFLLDEKSLATTSFDGSLKTWDVATGRQLLTLDVNEDVTGLAVAPDGRMLATASRDAKAIYRVDLWNAPADETEMRAAGSSE